jgi:hypothetical protein
VVTILVIMAAIWVLFFIQSVLLRRPLQGISKWVNAHQLTERGLVYGSKHGARWRHGRRGGTNPVEEGVEPPTIGVRRV